MRSSRQKLKLLRSLSSRSNGDSASGRQHLSNDTRRTTSPIKSNTHRPFRNNNHRSSKHSTQELVSGVFRENSSSSLLPDPNLCIVGENFVIQNTENAGTLPKMDTVLSGEVKTKAFNICRDYLHGAWKQIDLPDLVIKRVSGGLSNYLYHCSLPPTLAPIGSEPSQVLLRFYGQVHGEDALESLITESVIFTLLSERKLGPKLYGVFPGGRIEQFIPARPLLTHELRDPELSDLIARRMAQIHALNIPISKEASWLWGTMERWMSNIHENLPKISIHEQEHHEIILKITEYNLEEEVKWLRNFLPEVGSPVLFCHNDFQEGNILLRPTYETMDDKLALIDFEYCSYNYRGFDLANHFCEWSINNNVNTYPNFTFRESDLPSHEEMLRFIRKYVTVLKVEYKMNFPEQGERISDDSPLFNELHILKEATTFMLASNLFWALWSIVNAHVSKIPFGYWEYGLSRLETYLRLKKQYA